ncbi:hypothetical protein AB1K83_02465 [Sporosarcina sp. 179-K 3D1 HS]|uniref:hypothetical protein n=1 Tax=Sporosarcina sp. 179-K 3D1 HS TaxID=3232169 RepID=UPI0039A08003
MQNEPLLFIQAPPVYIRITFTDEEDIRELEESTSIFYSRSEEHSEELINKDLEKEALPEEEVIDPSIIRRVMYLASSFPRQIYKPLQFLLSEQTVTGTIEKIEGNSVFIELEGEDKQVIAIELHEIEDILWRGTSFQEV